MCNGSDWRGAPNFTSIAKSSENRPELAASESYDGAIFGHFYLKVSVFLCLQALKYYSDFS